MMNKKSFDFSPVFWQKNFWFLKYRFGKSGFVMIVVIKIIFFTVVSCVIQIENQDIQIERAKWQINIENQIRTELLHICRLTNHNDEQK